MHAETRYLKNRNNFWHYQRRVPKIFQKFDPRTHIRLSLRTQSIMIAKQRRNALERADNHYWSALVDLRTGEKSELEPFEALISQRYAMHQLQAVTLQINSLHYNSNGNLNIGAGLNSSSAELIKLIVTPRTFQPVDTPPPARVTEAFELYCNKIAFRDLINKSAKQKKRWHASRQTTLKNFIGVVGDKMVSQINREDALKFYGWWAARLAPKRGAKPLSPNGGNRDFGSMRKFYNEYHIYFGQEDKPNPFRELSFRAPITKDKRPPFEDEWVREKFLTTGSLRFLKQEDRCILYSLIETGCRASEITNLRKPDIKLDTAAPFIKIRPSVRRELKSPSSIRDIPLIGVALEAFHRYPDGFPSYKNKSERVSQHLLKMLRYHELMPTPEHVIYSFRHSFERRMLESGIDFDLRCRFMGHSIARPDYGGGGGIRFRREQLLKIAHPYPKNLFD